MAATISSSGTWTTLATVLPLATGPSVPTLTNIDPNDTRTPISEVDQMIRLVAAGYNTNYWAACVLLQNQLTALQNGAVPKAA